MPARPWNHNIHYHRLVLRALRPGFERALDVGCGRGLLARELAGHCDHVVAIDPDEEALEHARGLGDAGGRIEYVRGDILRYPLPEQSFDLIAAVATLHHLPLEPALSRFAELLKPGGVLVVIGLSRAREPLDYVFGAAAFPVHLLLKLLLGNTDVGAPLRDPRESFADIRMSCDAILPGAELRRLLLFRYCLVWHKP